MAFNPQQQDKPQYELPEEGTYPARCARVIEIGDQNTPYGVKTQVVLGYTVPSLKVNVNGEEKQQMFWTFPINQTSNPDGNLMKHVKALKPDATHLNQCLNQPCLLTIKNQEAKDGKMYTNIEGVTKPMAGLDIPMPDCDVYMYEFENGEDEVFEKLGEYRQKQIRAALNFDQLTEE